MNRVLVVFKRRLSEEPAGNWLIILNRAQKVTLEDICASIVKDAGYQRFSRYATDGNDAIDVDR